MLKALIVAVAVAPMAGCSVVEAIEGHGQAVHGSGKAKTEARKVGKFTHIAVKGATDCDVTVGKTQSVEITADDNLLSHVTTQVVGETLVISTKGSTSSHLGIKAKITVPELNGLDVSGSGDSTIRGVKSKTFFVSISGSGDVKADGAADNVSASIAGSGQVDLSGLKAKVGDISITGSGDVKVNAQDKLSASVAGSGNVKYFGNPKVRKTVMGSGDVVKG